jgi:hypothetical protein
MSVTSQALSGRISLYASSEVAAFAKVRREELRGIG